ncbi:MAG: hypothetical protein HOP29_02120 [Phycisphaerales bacterium]|nr:hypothetical protein [Phycisphaerales bacterium]
MQKYFNCGKHILLQSRTKAGVGLGAMRELVALRLTTIRGGGVWAVVSVDPSTLRVKAKRINITVPERVLDAVDRYAHERGETRSGLLVQAVTEYMGRAGDKRLTKAKRGRPRRTTRDRGGRK